MANDSKLLVQVGLVTSRGTSATEVRKIFKEVGNSFARMIIRDVVIQASNRYKKTIGRTMARSVEKTVRAEMDRMAKLIARSMIRPENANGPRGAMNLGTENGVTQSDTFRQRGWSQSYDAADSGITWAPRDRDYVARKRDKSWWKKRGQLQAFLSKRDHRWYERAFGPVRVIWTPTADNKKSVDFSKITSSGARGGLGQELQVGRIEVIAFGEITAEMLPGLASFQPMTSAPTFWGGAGVASRIAAVHYNRSTAKLMGRSTGKRRMGPGAARQRPGQKNRRRQRRYQNVEREYRPWIDPFVSFFLTRSVPNAVWRRLERQVNSERVVRANTSGRKDSSGLGAI